MEACTPADIGDRPRVAVRQRLNFLRYASVSAMNNEGTFRLAFWSLLGLTMFMRIWFAIRVRRAGERLLPDRAALRREGWRIHEADGKVSAEVARRSVIFMPDFDCRWLYNSLLPGFVGLAFPAAEPVQHR
jgi:hypothetical protein